MVKSNEGLDEIKRLMGALVRMKPKPHEEMKISKKKPQKSGKIPLPKPQARPPNK
jgi:hypothetical protein